MLGVFVSEMRVVDLSTIRLAHQHPLPADVFMEYGYMHDDGRVVEQQHNVEKQV